MLLKSKPRNNTNKSLVSKANLTIEKTVNNSEEKAQIEKKN